MPSKDEDTTAGNDPNLKSSKKPKASTRKKKRSNQASVKKSMSTIKKKDRTKKAKEKDAKKRNQLQQQSPSPAVLSKAHRSQSPQIKSPNTSDIRKFWGGGLKSTPKSNSKEMKEDKEEQQESQQNQLKSPSSPKDSQEEMKIKEEWNGNIPPTTPANWDDLPNTQQDLPENGAAKSPDFSEESEKEDEGVDQHKDLHSQDPKGSNENTLNNEATNHSGSTQNLDNKTFKGGESQEDKEQSQLEMSGEYDEDYDTQHIFKEDERETTQDQSGFTDEDDVDTIDSGATTVLRTQEQLNEVKELPSVRYQFSFLMEDVTLAQLSEEHEKEDKTNITEPTEIIKSMLQAIYARLMKIDPKSSLMSWSNKHKDGASYLSIDDCKELPDDAVILKKYFNGLNLKRKSGRIYIRFRFHAENQHQVYLDMKEWASANGYSMVECVIQTESSTNIGWMVYSSQYTDIDYLKSYIFDEIGIEVGFKMGAITSTDIWKDNDQLKKTEWKDRKKALAVHADSEQANAAISGIAKLFEPTSSISDLTYQSSTKDRFLFTRPEYTIPKNHKLRYKKLINSIILLKRNATNSIRKADLCHVPISLH